MPMTSKQESTGRAPKPREKATKRSAKPKDEAIKRPRKSRGQDWHALSSEETGWIICSVSNNQTHEDAMFTQGFPEVFGQPDVVWFTPPMTKNYDSQAANLAAGLWGGCINRMIHALLEQIKQGLVLKDGLVVMLSGAEIKLSAVEWRNRSLLEMVPTDPRLRAPWG